MILAIWGTGQSLASDEDLDIDAIPEEILFESENAELNTDQMSGQPSDSLPENEEIGGNRLTSLDITSETSLQKHSIRKPLVVPLPNDDVVTDRFRQSINFFLSTNGSGSLGLTVNDTLHWIYEETDESADDSGSNHLKELYVTWEPDISFIGELGRINLKNGIAAGFNPTDYFKKNAVGARYSDDQTYLRENRIGTWMARMEAIFSSAMIGLAYAPKIEIDEDSNWQKREYFGLGLADLNHDDRGLAKFSFKIFDDTKPEFIYYLEDSDRPHFGFSISSGFGKRVIAYAEFSLGNRYNIISETANQLREDGLLSEEQEFVFSEDKEKSHYRQYAFGFSYTEDIKRTTTFEYHYNEAGFNKNDWKAYFDEGEQAAKMLENAATAAYGNAILGQLWAIRDWSRNADEPLSQENLFIRSQWQEVWGDNFDLTGLLSIDLTNGGFIFQSKADYEWHDALFISFAATFYQGSSRTQYGSSLYSYSLEAMISYYFL